jgi:hypothetical protein
MKRKLLFYSGEKEMLPHPLVAQLRFARSEFKRGLEGITDEEARRRFHPMNCISWNIGHLAWQEQRYWLERGQSRILVLQVKESFGYGCPASTPALEDVWRDWNAITQESDPWLDTLTTEFFQQSAIFIEEENLNITYGSLILRTIYHYWYHTGENMAIRQSLGHTNLPDFVGDIDIEAPYRAEQ